MFQGKSNPRLFFTVFAKTDFIYETVTLGNLAKNKKKQAKLPIIQYCRLLVEIFCKQLTSSVGHHHCEYTLNSIVMGETEVKVKFYEKNIPDSQVKKMTKMSLKKFFFFDILD